ncbi:MAG: hypothetical protein AABY22_30255 [Nanoarchaeota archaeon]
MPKSIRLNNWKYLSPNPSITSGEGTISRPFDASTTGRFDTLMSGFKENDNIFLLAGTYKTRGFKSDGRIGNWSVKSGWKIQGEGEGKTVIQIDWANNLGVSDKHKSFSIFETPSGSDASDSEFKNLTLDLNFSQVTLGQEVTSIGMCLNGFNIKTERVEVINIGNYGNLSGFGICLNSALNYSNPSMVWTGEGNSIIDCTVKTVYYPLTGKGGLVCLSNGGNTTIGGMKSWALNPVIKDSYVNTSSGYFIMNGRSDVIGLSMPMCINGLVEYNITRNCKISGPYSSIFPTNSIEIRNNIFINQLRGIFYKLGAEKLGYGNTSGNFIHIHNNVFHMGYKTSIYDPIAIEIKQSLTNLPTYPPITHLTFEKAIIENNVFLWESGYNTFSQTLNSGQLILEHISGLTIENNYMDMPGTWGIAYACLLTGCRNHFVRYNNMNFRIADSGGSVLIQLTGNLKYVLNP